jgi:Uma2 family endonuclease
MRANLMENTWKTPPSFAIEVVSPTNTTSDMEKKMALYFRHGAREVGRVYRDPLHVVVHPADSSRTIWQASVTTPLLPGFELHLGDLLARTGQTAP